MLCWFFFCLCLGSCDNAFFSNSLEIYVNIARGSHLHMAAAGQCVALARISGSQKGLAEALPEGGIARHCLHQTCRDTSARVCFRSGLQLVGGSRRDLGFRYSPPTSLSTKDPSQVPETRRV